MNDPMVSIAYCNVLINRHHHHHHHHQQIYIYIYRFIKTYVLQNNIIHIKYQLVAVQDKEVA